MLLMKPVDQYRTLTAAALMSTMDAGGRADQHHGIASDTPPAASQAPALGMGRD
jgi:hypothetical protein